MRRNVKLLIIAAVVCAITLIVLLNMFGGHRGGGYTKPLDAPKELAGVPLANMTRGEKAIKIVKGLHWRPSAIEVEDAVVAVYRDGSILWVSKTPGACEAVRKMVEKMNAYAGILPYTPPFEEVIDGVRVYISIDMRDRSHHVFWCQDDLAIWVKVVDPHRVKEVVKELISFYGG